MPGKGKQMIPNRQSLQYYITTSVRSYVDGGMRADQALLKTSQIRRAQQEEPLGTSVVL